MIVYQVKVYRDRDCIFSHDVVMAEGNSFSGDVKAAIEQFRINFPDVDLLDESVRLSIGRKDSDV